MDDFWSILEGFFAGDGAGSACGAGRDETEGPPEEGWDDQYAADEVYGGGDGTGGDPNLLGTGGEPCE